MVVGRPDRGGLVCRQGWVGSWPLELLSPVSCPPGPRGFHVPRDSRGGRDDLCPDCGGERKFRWLRGPSVSHGRGTQ